MIIPVDFENRMKEYLGEEMESFLASYSVNEVKALRFSRGLTPFWGQTLLWGQTPSGGLSPEWGQVPWEPAGFYYDDEMVSPGKHPLHEAGAYYIQDASAMAPVRALDVKPGDRVLDLCAAPGGKSTQIGAYLNGEGILISNEIVGSRAKILSENIERMGIANALVISEDPRNIGDKFEGYFDKILVDAPCSGEGMFRRSEVAQNEWSLENVEMCAKRQEWILDEAVKMLAPGGRLVYSTCTFSKEENEENAKALVERHADMKIAGLPEGFYVNPDAKCVNPANNDLFEDLSDTDDKTGGIVPGYDGIGYRLWPHKVKGEGHYLCVFEKTGNSQIKNMPISGYEIGLNSKDMKNLKEMTDFIKDNMADPDRFLNSRFVKFGDQVYMIPKDCPTLKGLKVLRPGLHIGTMLKNRFEPGHALAMALSEKEYKNVCYLTLNNDVIYKYFRGETFDISGFSRGQTPEGGQAPGGGQAPFISRGKNDEIKNGWYLILIEGVSCGFGKLTGNTMKNHYPKGLRKNL